MSYIVVSGKLGAVHSEVRGNGNRIVVSPQRNTTPIRKVNDVKWIGQMISDGNCPQPAIILKIGNKNFKAILDSQASYSFVNKNVAELLIPMVPHHLGQVKGAVSKVAYSVDGQTLLAAKCMDEDIEITVAVIRDLIPEIILGHDFLVAYDVILDYAAQEIFLGKNKRLRVAWCDGSSMIQAKDKYHGVCLEGLDFGTLALNEENQLKNLLKEFPEVITSDIGFTTTVKHSIKCSDYAPIKQRPYPINPDKRNFVRSKVQEMERQGLIEPSNSGWASPIVLPKKKNGEYRLCVDFRRLNERTVSDAYPMPDLKDLLRQVNGAKIFSTLDLNSGYWQVEVEEKSRHLTAFPTPKGLFQFKVMPFGLKNAAATFARLMDRVLSGYISDFCQVYLDDILIYSTSLQDHFIHLAKVLERLKLHGLTCQLKKCHFAAKKVEYLGHVLTPKGLERQPEKNRAIEEAERPRTKRQVRQFLGLCGWYSSFMPHFEEKATPLTDLLHKGQPFKWTHIEETAFQEIKKGIGSAPMLAHPDPQRQMCLQTDASNLGLGAVLFQEKVGGGRDIVEYASRKLSSTEKNYCTAEKEALAVVWAVGKFRGFLEGRKFQLYTDNAALKWLNTVSGTKSKLMRWALILAEFDFEVQHVPGVSNQGADSLSRHPVAEPATSNVIPEREVPQNQNSIINEPVLMVFQEEFNLEILRKWQEEDKACKDMIQWIGRRDSHNYPVPKEFKMCYKNFRLEKGLLMYSSHISNMPSVVVVPRSHSMVILEKFHDSSEAGHPGGEETFQSIRRRFFWINMRKDITTYVQGCYICACTKASNQKADTSRRGRRPHRPWEVIALDLMGPYPRTSKGKTGLIVVTDLFTRWVEAFAIPEATTERIVNLLQDEVFSRYGYPRCILSDNGSQFTSKRWQRVTTDWGVEHWTTPVYNPRANPTERRNQELKRMLRIHLLNKEHKMWDRQIPQSLFSLRQRINRVTGYSPAELFLGRQLHRSGDWIITPGQDGNAVSLTTWQNNQQAELQKRCELAKKRISDQAKAQDIVEDQVFQPGHKVLRRNHPVSSKVQGFHAGLAPKWVGPFEVDKRLGHGVYMLKTTPPVKVHAAELRLVKHPLRGHGEPDAVEDDAEPMRAGMVQSEQVEGAMDRPKEGMLDGVQGMERGDDPQYYLRPRRIKK